jgi:hypothetical protein
MNTIILGVKTKTKMEYFWLLIVFLALAIVILFNPKQDHMTNKDLLTTLNAFSKSSKKGTPNEEPIYGPKVPELEEPIPASSDNSKNSMNMYPDIYGPEITPVPGKKKSKKGKHTSDKVDDETYEFNPDFKNAFPTEENEPQPFLTDFSKFQH